jgi:hypothetical protein
MSAIALFGNTSWLHSAVTYTTNMTYESARDGNALSWQRMCAGMPFAGLVVNDEGSYAPASSCRWADEGIAAGREPNSRDILRLVKEWMNAFAPQDTLQKTQMTESLFQISMFTASRALLTFYSPNKDGNADRAGASRGRSIYSAPGQMIQIPTVSTTTLAVLTVLIVLQLLALTYLAYYIYHMPTWCSALDAMAIARIGASLGRKEILPPHESIHKKDLDALWHVDGLVGIIGSQGEYGGSETRLPPNDMDDGESHDTELQLIHPKPSYIHVEQSSPALQLGLGAPGVIRQDSRKVVRNCQNHE